LEGKLKMARQNLIKTKCAACGNPIKRRPNMIGLIPSCNRTCFNVYKRGGVVINNDLKKEVRKLREEGWKYRELSEHFNLSQKTVWSLLYE
jgi:hypothetical protein